MSGPLHSICPLESLKCGRFYSIFLSGQAEVFDILLYAAYLTFFSIGGKPCFLEAGNGIEPMSADLQSAA